MYCRAIQQFFNLCTRVYAFLLYSYNAQVSAQEKKRKEQQIKFSLVSSPALVDSNRPDSRTHLAYPGGLEHHVVTFLSGN